MMEEPADHVPVRETADPDPRRPGKGLALVMAACVIASLAAGILFQRYVGAGKAWDKLTGGGTHAAAVTEGGGGRAVTLDTRVVIRPADGRDYETETDSEHRTVSREVDLSRSALILIDVWADHPDDGLLRRMQANRVESLVPLLRLARENGMTVIHASYGREIAADCRPLPDETVIDPTRASDDIEELESCLGARGIKTLFYAGYAANMCVLDRPVGIINMSRRGYDVILVRDCTVAFENAQTLEGEWAKAVAVDMVEAQWGSTTTLPDLRKAVSGD